MPVRHRVLSLLIAVILAATAASAAVWQPLGPAGGSVTALAVSPAAVYAGTNGGGVFKSTDQGAAWVPAIAGLPSRSVAALALDPADPERLYAALGDRLFRSEDGGGSWAPADAGLPRVKVTAVAVDADDPATLYAGSFSNLPFDPGLFRSTDRGASWSAIDLGDGQVVTRLATAPGAVFAGTFRNVFRSLDGGQTWTRVLDTHNVLALAVRGRTVYAGSWGGFFRSEDLGETWTPIDLAPVRGVVSAIAIAPTGAVYAGTSRLNEERPRLGTLLRSLDGGRTWARSGSGMGRQDFQALAVDPASPSRVYAGVVGVGIFRSRDAGATWSHAIAGLQALGVAELELDRKRPGILYAASERGLLRTDDAGAAWQTLAADLSGPLAMDAERTMTIYATRPRPAAVYPDLMRSRDGGRTWVPVDFPASGIFAGVRALATDPAISGRLYVASDKPSTFDSGLYRSSDYGRTWAFANLQCPLFTTLSAAPGSSLLLVGADPFCGHGFLGGGVFRSLDAGRSWTPANTGLAGGESTNVQKIAVDPRDPRRAWLGAWFVVFEGQIPRVAGLAYRSQDGGATWTQIPGFGERRALSFAFPPGSPSTVYIGTGQGVWESRDHGETWSLLGDGLEGFEVRDLALAPGDTALYAATSGGVFRLQLK